MAVMHSRSLTNDRGWVDIIRLRNFIISCRPLGPQTLAGIPKFPRASLVLPWYFPGTSPVLPRWEMPGSALLPASGWRRGRSRSTIRSPTSQEFRKD